MPRPKVTLPSPYLARTRYERDQVTILKVDDDEEALRCRVFVRLGNDESFKYWITVSEGDTYAAGPDQAAIEAAVIAFFGSLAPAA
jgi:hypothetical protein